MTWYFQDKPFTSDDIQDNHSFVYLITNLTSGKKYIGRKGFFFQKTRQVNKKKKKFTVESDWQTYFGSNKELQSDVEKLGEDQFKREILHLVKTKGTANYLETKEIFVRDAIVSEDYYNDWVTVKVSKNHVKL